MRFEREEKDSEIQKFSVVGSDFVQADRLVGEAGNSMTLPREMETITGLGLG